MIKFRSSVLALALLGGADAVGCYPGYTSAGNYADGDQVSVALREVEKMEVDCPPNQNGCGANGKKPVEKSVTKYYNFACHAPILCNGDRDPTGIYSDTAWTKVSECDKSEAPATNAPPVEWPGGGCPKAYSSGGDYASGDVVSVAKGSYALVYKCVDGDNSAWCGNDAYRPDDGQYWKISWTELGSCSGTIRPTASPVYTALADAGGCPAEHAVGGEYEEGDRVAVNGLVFACNSWPNGSFCGMAGFAPLSGGDAWKRAWTVAGYCSGTISPTASPEYVALENMGGCPDEWVQQSGGYDEGDKISKNGLVFACKGWPLGGHCGQAGYEPGVADEAVWKEAWAVVGYCDGSIGPTSSPSFDPENIIGACPDEWEAIDYEEGDKVAVTVSEAPPRKIAFACKPWPHSGHCGQFAPLAIGGSLGWSFAGGCNGSTGPTMSPAFDVIPVIESGCPPAYSASFRDYEAGDRVSIVTSTVPRRSIVYECRTWTAWCNQAAYHPSVSVHDHMAWELVGACSGSIAPTTSPIKYEGTCEYEKCNHGSYKVDCNEGTWLCDNGKKTQTGCKYTTEDVEVWSSGADYEAGDVVRLDRKRFKCRPFPNTGWCRKAAYKPTNAKFGLWTQAWKEDGRCGTPAPTPPPTPAPTPAPTPPPTPAPTTLAPTQCTDPSCEGPYACNWAELAGTDIYTDTDVTNDVPCGSCMGEEACVLTLDEGGDRPMGTDIGQRTCVGKWACWAIPQDILIGDDSCHGDSACYPDDYGDLTGIEIGNGSCHGDTACGELEENVKIGDNSCKDEYGSCYYLVGHVGDGSCIGGEYSCYYYYPAQDGTIGDNSCDGERSCYSAESDVGNGSCLGEFACYKTVGRIGHNSCHNAPQPSQRRQRGRKLPPAPSVGACYKSEGIVGDGSCIDERACDSLSSSGEIGDGSCKGVRSCYGIDIKVGDGSCLENRSCYSYDGDEIGDNSCDGDHSCFRTSSEVGEGSCHGDYACHRKESNSGKIPDNSCNGDCACCVGVWAESGKDCPCDCCVKADSSCTPSSTTECDLDCSACTGHWSDRRSSSTD